MSLPEAGLGERLPHIILLRRCSFPQSTHLREGLARHGYEQLGLFKRGEVTTFWKPYPVRLVNWFMSK